MHWITGRLNNPALFISGFQADTGFDLPDIRPYQFIKLQKCRLETVIALNVKKYENQYI
jgi:hypothetical protein